ncbi:hypothetical protein [Brevifollis gellanilyticus]|uniref:Uncharacterized protein n=1 Tax=Brevifollis gellanilyticus TaxID=748831 RepID=A0A512MI15_9BACT|nr:hypothetical protein [Brevifollis gellanilyticus]GEP46374.1 hypothetical protein BGE01nite_56650 [Brevifollis gellanilyticus]
MNHLFSLASLALITLGACATPQPAAPAHESTTTASTGGDWGFLKFAEVRAYRMNWKEEDAMEDFANREGRLNPTRRPKEGVKLNAGQVTRLQQAITGHHPKPRTVSGQVPPVMACFYPHHAFAFRDEKGQHVGWIEVCFICGGHRGEPRSFSETVDMKAVATLLKDLGIPLWNPAWD